VKSPHEVKSPLEAYGFKGAFYIGEVSVMGKSCYLFGYYLKDYELYAL
jgi:hypothetical protein